MCTMLMRILWTETAARACSAAQHIHCIQSRRSVRLRHSGSLPRPSRPRPTRLSTNLVPKPDTIASSGSMLRRGKSLFGTWPRLKSRLPRLTCARRKCRWRDCRARSFPTSKRAATAKSKPSSVLHAAGSRTCRPDTSACSRSVSGSGKTLTTRKDRRR